MAESLLTECPNSADLAAWVSGTIDESAAEPVFAHLRQCADCRSRVDELLTGSDSLLDVVRRTGSNNSVESDDRLDDMIRQAQQLRLAGASQQTRLRASDETARKQRPNVNLPTFLSALRRSRLIPREQIDELVNACRPRGSAGFAAALTDRNLLTPFQARCLLRGTWKGLVLGNYVILDKLGRGGMAQVFKARHRKMGRIVCLKTLPRSARRNRQLLERFRREAQAIAALDHDNIVVGHDADEADGILFLVMEYIEGRDLARIVREDGPLSVDAALDVILQAARALGHAHEQGIIHRDIKPHNLLLDTAGTVKVLDMGIARFDPLLGENADGISQATMTGTDVVMGTIDYMSPEQALNLSRADDRSDIYSLGCTLYFLLTGNTPFEGTTMMEKLVAHREQPPPRLAESCPHATPGLEVVFARMVAKHPEKRYRSMAELIDDVTRLRQGARPRSQAIVPLNHLQRRRDLLAGGVLLAALLAGGAWFARGPEESDPRPIQPPPGPPPPIVGHPETIANGGQGRVLLIVPGQWFHADQFTAVTGALSERGVEWVVASSRPGIAHAKHGEFTVPVNVALAEFQFDANDYDGIIFIGGNVVYEFGHKNPAAAAAVRGILESCLDHDRFAAGLADGVDALVDSGLLQDATPRQQGNLWLLHPPGRSGLLLKAPDPGHAAELVAASISQARTRDSTGNSTAGL